TFRHTRCAMGSGGTTPLRNSIGSWLSESGCAWRWSADRLSAPTLLSASTPAKSENVGVAHSNERSNSAVEQSASSHSEVVDIVDVHGTFEQILPGHELRTLRYYPREVGFIPHGSVALDRSSKTWRVSRFNIGGESGDEAGN